MSQKNSLAASPPRHFTTYHPQPAGIGHHVQGGFKFIGNLIGIAIIAGIFHGSGAIKELAAPILESLRSVSSVASRQITKDSPTASPTAFNHRVSSTRSETRTHERLYLMDKASLHVSDEVAFETKVRNISSMLGIAPEWLMAVMYSESKFDASVKNFKGSGATGLIQFMEASASEMNVSLERLARMNHLQQLEYVYLYLQTVRDRYGDYEGLTDLYLAVLYPKARKQEYCYTLYARPSGRYNQNSGLDENRDGRVTLSDIDRRMKRLYPTAFIAEPAIS